MDYLLVVDRPACPIDFVSGTQAELLLEVRTLIHRGQEVTAIYRIEYTGPESPPALIPVSIPEY